jgi:Ni,Fe-hydrogenase III large subunit
VTRDPRQLVHLHNGEAVALERLPRLEIEAFRSAVVEGVQGGLRVASLFAMESESRRGAELVALLADDLNGEILAAGAAVSDGGFRSMTPDCPQVHLFEREIAEQHGLRIDGHPWMKPVRFAPPLARASRAPHADGAEAPRIGATSFYRVEGDQVHEVAVGPVHAGVIEPGHFRFQCHGEQVFHLEISLGYQHRGIEEAIIGGPHRLTPHQIETAAGDATIAHAWAYCQNLEALGAFSREPSEAVSPRAHVLRSLALELERLANHTGDLGALAGDVGYLPTMSFCGRIRGDFLNMTALLCGNRFGRSFVRSGGTRFDLEARHVEDLLHRIDAARRDVTGAVELLWAAPSVMARFENTGRVSRDACVELGLVGPAARACGVERDVRNDHPTGMYQFAHIPVSTVEGGDVNARAFVRWLEIQRSLAFIREQLQSMPDPSGGAVAARPALAPSSLAVSLIESWRGEVCHAAVTDAAGRLARYKITDPSFHNWMGLAMALRDQQISDFPLANKSFNLSYCGHDL